MKNNLKQRVMFKIYIEYVKNVFIQNIAYLPLLVFLFDLFVFVSIRDVLKNMPRDNFSQTFNFLFVAIRDTGWLLKILIGYFLVWGAIHLAKLAYKNMNKNRFLGLLKVRY